EAAVLEKRAAHGSLGGEAGLLVATLGPQVLLVDVEIDPLQAQVAGAEVVNGVQGIGPIALVPLRLFADGDPERGIAALLVDLMQADGADRAPILQKADDEVVVPLALALEHAVEPALLCGTPHGRTHRQVPHGVRVVEPAHEVVEIAALGWAQVYLLAADDGVGRGSRLLLG